MILKNKISHQKFLDHFFSGIVFITDCRRVPDYIDVVNKLSNYSIVIMRDYHLSEEKRYQIGLKLSKICKQKKHLFLVAKDFHLAIKLKADGIHLPEKLAPHIIAKLGNYKSSFFISLATHLSPTNRELRKFTNLFLLSQFFSSISHKNTTYIPYYSLINKSFALSKVAALGGVDGTNCKKLQKGNFVALAAIGGIYSIAKTKPFN